MLRRPVIGLALASAIGAGFLLLGVWLLISKLLQASAAAETGRLLDAFEEPLAAAVAKGDDLAKIDHLARLQKLPGVLTATVGSGPVRRSSEVIALIWEGKTIGWLKIHLSRTPWQRWRFRCIERMWTLMVLMGLAGGGAGRALKRSRDNHRLRLIKLLARSQQRHRSSRQQLRKEIEAHFQRWLEHALSISPSGVVLLNDRQRLIAFNRRARDVLQLPPPQDLHWLDLQKSPGWAEALRNSLEHPGERVPGPPASDLSETSLLTLRGPGLLPDSTWIVLH